MSEKKQKRRRKRKHSKFFGVFRFFVELLFLILLVLVLFVTYKYSRMTIDKVAKNSIRIGTGISPTEQFCMEGYRTLPVFLVDGESERMEEILILASIEKEKGNVRFLSIDTDSWLTDEEGYEDQCREIYEVNGPASLVTCLNDSLHLNMEDYLVLRTCIIKETVDRFGGIEVSFAEGETRSVNEVLSLNGKETVEGAGRIRVNGDQAMAYLRNQSSPTPMMDRISEAAEELLVMGERQKLGNVNHVTDELLYHVSTSLSFMDFCSMLKELLVYEIKPHGVIEGEAVSRIEEIHAYLYEE